MRTRQKPVSLRRRREQTRARPADRRRRVLDREMPGRKVPGREVLDRKMPGRETQARRVAPEMLQVETQGRRRRRSSRQFPSRNRRRAQMQTQSWYRLFRDVANRGRLVGWIGEIGYMKLKAIRAKVNL